jgi:hypothetical protein
MTYHPEEAPFWDIPGGIDIAHYFLEEKAQAFDGQGADGIALYRDGRAYSYLWVMAHVDLDLDQFYLLDIRTAGGTEPFDETRDFLLVMSGVSTGGKPEVEWENRPIDFASHDHIDRLHRGLKWFANGVVSFVERHHGDHS